FLRRFEAPAQDGQSILGQAHHKLVIAFQLLAGGDLAFDKGLTKVLAEKPIGALSIIKLVVVGGRIAVLVPLELALLAGEPERGPNGVEVESLHDGAPETAIILSVVDQERGPRRDHRRQVRVVDALEHVGRVLLEVSEVAMLAHLELGKKRRVAGYGNRDLYPLVERAEDQGLPAAAGKARHTQPVAVDVRMSVEVIETPAHLEKKQTERVHARQIQVRAEPVRISLFGELAKVEPFHVQRQDAVLGEVDAALLLVLNRLPGRPHVYVHVQNGRDFPVEVLRLVKN